MDSTYECVVRREVKYLLLVAVLALIAGWVVLDAVSAQDWPRLNFAILPGLGVLLFLFMYFHDSSDDLLFKTADNRDPLFVLWTNKPDKERFDIDLKHLQFLCDEGVISTEEARQIAECYEGSMKKSRGSVVRLVD